MKALIDTNILVYAADPQPGKAARCPTGPRKPSFSAYRGARLADACRVSSVMNRKLGHSYGDLLTHVEALTRNWPVLNSPRRSCLKRFVARRILISSAILMLKCGRRRDSIKSPSC